jgi:hypothetical protein
MSHAMQGWKWCGVISAAQQPHSGMRRPVKLIQLVLHMCALMFIRSGLPVIIRHPLFSSTKGDCRRLIQHQNVRSSVRGQRVPWVESLPNAWGTTSLNKGSQLLAVWQKE